MKETIIGMQNRMKNGMLATVIADRGSDDIDIQFEDGTIVEHSRRDRFKSGNIANPTIGRMICKTIKYSIMGQSKTMKNGMVATVIADRGKHDIDVRFDNGMIAYHRERASFKNGTMTPFPHLKSIVGQSNIMNNGMLATVIADRGGKDIDVQFADGTVVRGKTRDLFRKGYIRNPSLQGRSKPQSIVYFFIKKYFPDATQDFRPDWLKNPNTNNNLELDIWVPSICIGIEYDGFIPSHKKKTKLGTTKRDLIISAPEIKHLYTIHEKDTYGYIYEKNTNYWLDHTSFDKSYDLYRDLEKVLTQLLFDLGITTTIEINNVVMEQICLSYIGEQRIMNNGMLAKIIAYRSYDDIDVEFADGTIIPNRDVNSFRTGGIALPSWHSCVGEKRMMNNGMIATAIADRSSDDVEIMFEDGIVVTTHRYKFRNGTTLYPRQSMVGTSNIMHCGMKATVIADRGINDLDIIIHEWAYCSPKFIVD